MSETTEKNCQINVWNQLGWGLDEAMLAFVMGTVVPRHLHNAERIEVYPQEREPQELPPGKTHHRDPPGWCEWTVNIKYRTGGTLTIGCIQRSLDAKFETHT